MHAKRMPTISGAVRKVGKGSAFSGHSKPHRVDLLTIIYLLCTCPTRKQSCSGAAKNLPPWTPGSRRRGSAENGSHTRCQRPSSLRNSFEASKFVSLPIARCGRPRGEKLARATYIPMTRTTARAVHSLQRFQCSAVADVEHLCEPQPWTDGLARRPRVTKPDPGLPEAHREQPTAFVFQNRRHDCICWIMANMI